MIVGCKFFRAATALLAITFVLCALPAWAQSNIGSTSLVKNIVQGVHHNEARTLAVGSSVFSDDTVRAGKDSLGQILFIDQTRLTVAANSQAVLKLVYHPKRSFSDLVLRNVIGAFRYVSGSRSLQKRLEFPFGYITVRGTVIDLLVWRDRAVIILREGSITVVPYATGIPHDLATPGTYLTVFADGRVVGPRTLTVSNAPGYILTVGLCAP